MREKKARRFPARFTSSAWAALEQLARDNDRSIADVLERLVVAAAAGKSGAHLFDPDPMAAWFSDSARAKLASMALADNLPRAAFLEILVTEEFTRRHPSR